MKNPYLEQLNKIEFVVTYACTGKCKHCSEGDHAARGERIDPAVAADAVRRITALYPIETAMAFGGEPLLHPDAVYAIIEAAREAGVPRRQVITNGYFSENPENIRGVAARLAACGVNDLLLSADAFHQESIPLATVKAFAREVKTCGIPIRLQPAWLVSPTDGNPYNEKTREILNGFGDMGIPAGEGNVIFPEGNARKYLAEYFTDGAPENPYTEDPCVVKTLSISPNGDLLGGNVYREDVMRILENYEPKGIKCKNGGDERQ